MSEIETKSVKEPFTEIGLAKALRIPTAVLVAGLSVLAFVISYDALRDLAKDSGVPHPQLFPIIVDGLIIVATFAALSLKKLLPQAVWYPWAALFVFAVLSIWGNALHASSHANLAVVSVEIAAVVSAIPPVSLLLASHLLVLMVQSTTDSAHLVAKAKPVRAKKPVAAATQVAVKSERPKAVTEDLTALVDQIQQYESLHGKKVTGQIVADWLSTSERTGRRKLKQVQALLGEAV